MSCESNHGAEAEGEGVARKEYRVQRITALLRAAVAADAKLSAREREVLALVTRGLSTNCMAERLAISPAVVQQQVERLFRKLEVDNGAAAGAKWSLICAAASAARRVPGTLRPGGSGAGAAALIPEALRGHDKARGDASSASCSAGGEKSRSAIESG